MSEFNREKIDCPRCKASKLKVIKDNNKIIRYTCTNCGSDFDPYHERDNDKKIVRYFLKMHSPDYAGSASHSAKIYGIGLCEFD